MIYLVLRGSPAERVLIRNLDCIRPGRVLRCTQEELDSFQVDFVMIPGPNPIEKKDE